MKIKTKIFLTLALLIVVLSAFILVSSAEGPTTTQTVTNVDELNSAISDANVTYIKLGADFTVDEPITVARSGITIDLNGYTITAYKSNVTTLFEFQNNNIEFKITGSGIFNTSRTLFYTGKTKSSNIMLSATGEGITIKSPDSFEYPYFKVGVSSTYQSSLTISGALHIFHSIESNNIDTNKIDVHTFEINDSSTLNITNAIINDSVYSNNYEAINFICFNAIKNSNLNISNSQVTNKHGSLIYIKSGLIGSEPEISVESSHIYALDGCILTSSGTFSKLGIQNSSLEYTNCAFKETTLTGSKYYLNLTMTNTQTKFIGTTSSGTALLNGKITAIIDGGFHNLNGASLAIGTTKYDASTQKGVLIKTGTAISCEFASTENIAIENENAEVAKWFDNSGKFIAMGYYDSAKDAKIDTSILPIVINDKENYNLKYVSWTGTLVEGIYKFTPATDTMEPTPSLKGIKYNLSTYTNFNMNIYIPSSIDIVGAYADAACSYPLDGTIGKIEQANYTKYTFEFGASNMDNITMYVKYNVIYNTKVYTLVQEISVSVIDYAEAILIGNEFSETEKMLAADMLRYCNETLKLADGSYNSYASEILDEHSTYLTDLNTLIPENTDTDTSALSDYISEAMLLFNAYEPKLAFRYTDKITLPSASESDGCIWLSISYISVDGSPKSAKIEVDTENKLYYTTGISAYDIDELFVVELHGSDSNEPIATGTYSLSSYISSLQSTSIDITFAKALYAYSLSAEAYKKEI